MSNKLDFRLEMEEMNQGYIVHSNIKPEGSIDKNFTPIEEPLDEESYYREESTYSSLLNDLIFAKLPSKGLFYDTEEYDKSELGKISEKYKKRVQEAKILVIGAEYQPHEVARWGVFDKNYIGLGRYEGVSSDNPFEEMSWSDKSYWKIAKNLLLDLRDKPFETIVFDYGVIQHLTSSPDNIKELVELIHTLLSTRGYLYSIPALYKSYFSLQDIREGKNIIIHPQILFLRELYKYFIRIDQGYLAVPSYMFLYDRWKISY